MSYIDGGIRIGGLSVSENEISLSIFDLFEPVDINTSIVSSSKVEARPVSNTQNNHFYTFIFPPDPTSWTQPDSIRLSGKMRIMRKVNNMMLMECGQEDDVSCINNYVHSLFNRVDVKLNDTEIGDPSSSPYPYKAHFETLFSYSKSTKEGRLGINGFNKDTANSIDSITTAIDGNIVISNNSAYLGRKNIFRESKWVYFSINLHTGLADIKKCLPPNVKIEITLNR